MDFESLIETCYSLASERASVRKSIKTEEEVTQWHKDTLHFYRMQIEPYVFNYLNMTYGQKLDEFWHGHSFPKKSRHAFVIIERRCHPNWWFILRNIAWAAPHFSLYIFCSDLNYEFVKAVLGNKAENVHIMQWFKGVADRHTGYIQSNISLQMPQFYKQIDAEWCINVHMDAYFLQKIPDWIFTGVYYGSPWGWDPHRAGNGGLAVRNIPQMIDLCQREIKNAMNECGEDVYISDALVKHGFDIPPLDFRIKVFQENFPTPFIPIGTHQFWTYLHNYNIDNRGAFTENIKKLVTLIGI
jgi:hypothetical protein